MKIWLDDERDPTLPFIQDEYGATSDMVWIKDVQTAKCFIQFDNVEFISFDNDLGWFKEEGYDLAKWIEEKAFKGELKPIKWAVHTANTTAYTNITKAMLNANKYWGIIE